MSFDELHRDFLELLKKNGLKSTQQRDAILEAVYEHKGHFSSEELHREVQEQFPHLKVGIATIYRSLGLLEEAGLVTSIALGTEGKRYEYGRKEHHDHMVCDRCGKLIEFMDEVIEKRQEAIAKEAGFRVTSHSMQIHGICADCRKKED